MGWVTRATGGCYLYRPRRVGGRVVTEYLGAEGSPGAALLGAKWASDRSDRVGRALDRLDAAARLGRSLQKLAALDRLAADAVLAAAAHGLLTVAGYHRPKRGGWRMRRGADRPAVPPVQVVAPADDAGLAAAFAAARAGDAAAAASLPAVLASRGLVDRLGDLGAHAARLLVRRAAGGDPVLTAALTAKARELREALEGDRPTALERLLVRRVVNSWLLAHAVECELAAADDARAADAFERLLGRVQRRLTGAAGELARVRRLNAPRVLARLRLTAHTTQPQPDPGCPP
jgi:hypothetical protein